VPPRASPVLDASSNKLGINLLDTRIIVHPRQQQQQNNDDDPRTPVGVILRELLLSEWRRDDLFQVPLLLYTVLKMTNEDQELLQEQSKSSFLNPDQGGQEDEHVSQQQQQQQLPTNVKSLIAATLEARPRRRDGSEQHYSDYILFQCTQVYTNLYSRMMRQVSQQRERNDASRNHNNPTDPTSESSTSTSSSSSWSSSIAGLPAQAVPDGVAAQLSLALSRCAEVSLNQLCSQLALRSAGDSNSFDIMRLAYALLTYIVATQALAGTAGRELAPGQGPSPGTRIGPVNRLLVQAALQAFFEEQNDSGLWDKGQPIYRSFRKTGRSIGNAFIYSVDTLASLLEYLPARDFRPHLTALYKALGWIEFHQTVEILPDYCDPDSGQCYGKALRGWSSPHLTPDAGPQAWSTAQTITCICRMRRVVETLMHDNVLREFRGMAFSSTTATLGGGVSTTAWDRLLDTDLGSCDTNKDCITIKDVLWERMIAPRVAASASAATTAVTRPVVTTYSAILFGPPGTAKTTICESLAQRLGWDFVVIDTTVFLADGLTNVAARIQYVFERLQALRRCVILFDEIEEFCLDRETPGMGMESRMLTTAMLTAINDLRRAQKSIFFVATNRLRAFDSAITRPGRFDMQLFVGTPNLQARQVQLRQKLADFSTIDAPTKAAAMDAYTAFLSRVWNDDARFMNYLEGVQFAQSCANIVAQGYELTDEKMLVLLQTQASVMTVRSPVRQEFLASMNLTRL
jgi:ATPase family associated with various cellular activities (AAA)